MFAEDEAKNGEEKKRGKGKLIALLLAGLGGGGGCRGK
jgi:hypothetical protein